MEDGRQPGFCGFWPALSPIRGEAVKIDLRKIYRFTPMDHASGAPLPNGGDIYYECTVCNGVISSVPRIPSACECGNLSGNGGEAVIKEADKVNPVRGKLK
jgi:hypothetical protein